MLSGARVDKFERPRVETLPFQTLFRLSRAVDHVAEQRVADVRHVDADLVRAPGLELAADVRKAGVPLDDLPVRHGVAGVFLRNGHALSIGRMAADGRVHGAGIGAESAVNNGLVDAGKAPVGELRRERLMGEIVFRHDQKTARVAVDAMYDAGAQRAATGENAVVVNCRNADIIVGPIGIVIADALLGEITPAMATAVCQSSATRVLIPVNHCENYIVGVPDQPIGSLVAAAVQKVKALCAGKGC